MHTEIEERVLNIDEKTIAQKLESIGATKVGEWMQKRYVYDFSPKRNGQWIRLRDTGKEITLTYKNIEKNSIDGTKELEIKVSSFEETNQLLNILGYQPKAYQENRRIRYIINNVEVDIDTWPLIPTYLEIEGKSIEEVKQVENLLEINQEDITSLNCQDIYLEKYGIDIETIKELKF